MNQSAPTHQEVTQRWLRQIVVGLNLCPFAAGPLQRDKVWYRVSRSRDEEGLYRDLLQALDDFIALDSEAAETGLFIMGDTLADFDDFLDFLALAEGVMESLDLAGFLQLASFHPRYRFAGSDEEDPANYSNRSPYPMFHFIREAELEEALASYPDPENIPLRNIKLLQDLGLEEMRRRLAACYQGPSGDSVAQENGAAPHS